MTSESWIDNFFDLLIDSIFKTLMIRARGSQKESDVMSSTTLSPATSIESYANSSLQITVHKLNEKIIFRMVLIREVGC